MKPPATDTGDPGTVHPPRHNWRPTVVQGGAVWLLLTAVFAAPLGATAQLGAGLVGLCTAPIVPVALYCDYRQTQRHEKCAPGVGTYLRNLGHDVVTTLTERESLGSERGRLDRC